MTDDNVQKPHAMQVAESLGEQDINVDVICVEPGEESKSLEMAEALWQGLLDLDTDRKTVVAAVGGGVIGDLAGFIAATFARGFAFSKCPRRSWPRSIAPSAARWASICPTAKNMIGAFYQPLGVLIDTATLATLPPVEFRAGLAEVVKYGVILDAEFFAYLEQNAAALLRHDQDVLAHVIARCCRLKADVVEQDEHEESGLRAMLNFGHTFGHAFETLSGYGTLLHGEAVSIGMVCAARLAERLERVDAAFTARLRSLLETLACR